MEEEWPPINPNRNNYIWWHNYATRWGDNDIYGHVNNNIYYSSNSSNCSIWQHMS